MTEAETMNYLINISMEEKMYTLKDLVSFGNYLLSEERNANIASEEAKKYVGDWDIANWKVKG